MIEATEPVDWRELQEVVACILRDAGYEATVDCPVPLARGRKRIDVCGFDRDSSPRSQLFVECKLWRRRVTQTEVHAFRTVVADAGANEGLIVSAQGFQSGAREAAAYTNVRLVTWPEFQHLYAVRWMDYLVRPALSGAFEMVRRWINVYSADEDRRLARLPETGLQAFWDWTRRVRPLVELAGDFAMPPGHFFPGEPRIPGKMPVLPLADHGPAPELASLPDSLLHIAAARPFFTALLVEKDRAEADLAQILGVDPGSGPEFGDD